MYRMLTLDMCFIARLWEDDFHWVQLYSQLATAWHAEELLFALKMQLSWAEVAVQALHSTVQGQEI